MRFVLKKKIVLIICTILFSLFTFCSYAAEYGTGLIYTGELGEDLIDDNLDIKSVKSKTDSLLGADYEQRYISDYYAVPLKNQGSYSTCWAFSTIAAAESSYMINTGSEYSDFSEKSLVYFAYKENNDPLGLTGHDQTISIGGGANAYMGNMYISAFLMSGWMGANEETTESLKYKTNTDPLKQSIDNGFKYEDAAILKDAYFLPKNANAVTVNRIKAEIKNNGAVCIAILNFSNNNIHTYNNEFFYNSNFSGSEGHALTIIGWDDAKEWYDKNTKGAWYIRNSWGESNSYFWIPYDDNKLSMPTVMSFISSYDFDKNYHYDGTGASFYKFYDETASLSNAKIESIGNVFRVDSSSLFDESLDAVQIGIKSIRDYQIDIYTSTEPMRDPESGILATSQSGRTTASGIYTIDLNNSVELHPGDYFSIVVRFTENDSKPEPYYEKSAITDGIKYINDAKDGQSYYKLTDSEWYDAVSVGNGVTFRIKGLTSLIDSAKISFISNTDKAYKSIWVKSGSKIASPSNPVMDGFNFLGWGEDGIKVNLDNKEFLNDTKLIALWDYEEYSIVYNLNGGSFVIDGPETYNAISDDIQIPNPVKYGYTFAGWTGTGLSGKTLSVVIPKGSKGNRTYKANWDAKPVTVSFDSNGGSDVSSSVDIYFDTSYGTLPITEKSNYTFLGWFTEKTGGMKIVDNSICLIPDNHTLYAHWEGQKHKVSFDLNGGSGTCNPIIVEYDKTYGTLPTVSRYGYTFIGWYTDKNNGDLIVSESIVAITTDTKLFAHWSYSGSGSGGSGGSGGGGKSGGSGGGPKGAGPGQTAAIAYSPRWAKRADGKWIITNSKGQLVTNAWLCDDVVPTNGKKVWYLIQADGTMLVAGLVQDNSGNFYSMELDTNNNHFGMLRYQSGYYNCNGQQVYLQFEENNISSLGAIKNADGLAKLMQIYGVTRYNIGNESATFTATF